MYFGLTLSRAKILALNASHFLKVGGHFDISIKVCIVVRHFIPQLLFDVVKITRDSRTRSILFCLGKPCLYDFFICKIFFYVIGKLHSLNRAC